MKEQTKFYIKYLDKQPVLIYSQNLNVPQGEDPVVAKLISTYKDHVKPLLENCSITNLSLHLPESYTRSSLEENCFSTIDEKDTSLRVGLPLDLLKDIGSDDKKPLIIKSKLDEIKGHGTNPLIIKSKNDAGQGIFSKILY